MAGVIEQKRWREISRLYYEALQRPAGHRAAFLDDFCAGDDALRLEVSSLLDCHSEAADLILAPALETTTHPTSEPVPLEAFSIIGQHLGAYRIESRLGAGGMGEVYRATDVRLHRPVAIKILPRHLREDTYLRERLEREALAVAALRHPHICVLYDIGRHEDIEFLVMEYLEGETLAERLTRGPLPVSEALTGAREMCGALIETHRHGIVHGDLKPGNIMLTADGFKLLDYGLATQPLPVPIPSAADGTTAFRVPAIAGTLPYMAPEQLLGNPVDARTDIYALGAILFEMVVGRKAFEAGTRAGVAATILKGEAASMPRDAAPDARALVPLIRKCLARDPEQRWQHATELADALRTLAAGAQTRADTRPSRRRIASVAAAAIALSLLGAAAMWRAGVLSGDPAARPSESAVSGSSPLVVGNMRQLTFQDWQETYPAVAPDGTRIAYSAGTPSRLRIYIKSVTDGTSVPLQNESGVIQVQPKWSPDGTRILYITPEGAFVQPASGGTPRQVGAGSSGAIRDTGDRTGLHGVSGAAWAPDGRAVAIARGPTMSIVPLDGDAIVTLPAVAPDTLHQCEWSPDGRWIACVSGNWTGLQVGNIAPSAIVLVPVSGRAVVPITGLTAQNRSPAWGLDSTRLYYVSTQQGTGDIYSVAISMDGTAVGEPARVTTGLSVHSFAFSRERTRLAYAVSSARANLWSLPIPRRGVVNVSGAEALTSGDQVVEDFSFSPDGKWLVFDSTLNGNADIFRMPAEGGPPAALTTDAADDFAPQVSPDGRMLAFHSWRTRSRDVFVKPFAGGPEEQVTRTPSQESYPDWLPDSRSLVFLDQALHDGAFVGWFTIRRDASRAWGTPMHTGLPLDAGSLTFMPGDRGVVYARLGMIERAGPDFQSPRVIYRPDEARGEPRIGSLDVSEDGATIYFKAIDDIGHASFWSLPATGGRPHRLVQFDDLSRTSSRYEFEVHRGQLYFTIEERRGNIWIADVAER